MRRLHASAVLLALTSIAAAPPAPEHNVDGLMAPITATRGLKLLTPVVIRDASPEQVRREATADLYDPALVAEFLAAEAALERFGLAPSGFDLRQQMVDLLSQGMSGYYDPETDQLTLVDRADASDDEASRSAVVVHELMHAAQDQRYDLFDLNRRVYISSDAELAVRALVEGDAEYTTVRVAFLGSDDPFASTTPDALAATYNRRQPRGPYSSFNEAPQTVQAEVLFPYADGVLFAHAVWWQRGWEGLDAAFATPPLSTEHILHPDKYLLANDPPLLPELPSVARALGMGWTLTAEDSFGELGIRSLLRTRASGMPSSWSERAADGWGGDRYQIVSHRSGRTAAVWVSRWDSERDATEFARSIARVAEAPSSRAQARRDRSTGWSVHSEGTDVIVLVDVPAKQAAAIVDGLRGFSAVPMTSLDAVATPRAVTPPVP